MANAIDLQDKYDCFPFRLGSFECVALCDGGLDYTLESMVKNAPRSEVQAYLQAHGLPPGFMYTPYTYPYVNTGQHRILVDTGAGNLFPTTGRLLQSMAKANISPESIEHIFISHAHPDHVGGVLNDKGELNFPNAKYYIWKKEWDFWFSEQAFEQAGEVFITFARAKLPALKERIVLIDKEEDVLPGV